MSVTLSVIKMPEVRGFPCGRRDEIADRATLNFRGTAHQL